MPSSDTSGGVARASTYRVADDGDEGADEEDAELRPATCRKRVHLLLLSTHTKATNCYDVTFKRCQLTCKCT